MELRSIKTYTTSWGTIYIEGNWYNTHNESTSKANLIINYDKYYEHLRMISTSVKWIRQGYNQEDLPSVIPGYLQYGDVTKLYTKEIEFPVCMVNGEIENKSFFCTLSKNSLIEKYGSCKFNTSVQFLEDYFDTKQKIRNELINTIISG